MDTGFVGDFVCAAAEFCSFVESPPATTPDDFRRAAERVLIELYRHAIDLPHVEPADSDPARAHPSQPSRWPGFDDAEIYWMLFDSRHAAQPVCGSLSDDFLDIYRDVKTGLLLWNADDRAEAVWHWRFNFEAHWGRHAVEAMRALHLASIS